VKGQGLARLLAEYNCVALGVNLMNIDSKYQQDGIVGEDSHVSHNLAGCPWYKDIIYFLQKLKPPDGLGKNNVRDLKLKAIKYCIIDQILYWKNPLGDLLRCLDPQEAQRDMSDFHQRSCGGNHFWRTTMYKILRAWYLWPNLFIDVFAKIGACTKCQKFVGKKQLKYFPLKPVAVSGPFQQWGLNFIGEIHLASSGQHRWIFTATNYFTKWIESIPTRSASHKVILNFLEDIISRFGCPSRIFTDNATSFIFEPLINFYE
jgi:hypothetical protein